MSDRDDGEAEKGEKKGIRTAISRKFMSIGVFRRWYVKRMIKFMDKNKEKGRRLPEGMAETARYLNRVPKGQRAKVFEDAILTNQEMPNMGREMRRAAERQRRSGKNDARTRPGLPPGAIKQARQGQRPR